MKTTKFRAWHKEQMWEVAQMAFNPNGASSLTLFSNGDWLTSDSDADCKFMQYTGLSDKNGIEIYEGDILEGSGVKSEVVYDTDTASFITLTNGNKARMSVYDTAQWVAVIGNIYENPELRIKNDG